MRGLTTRAAGIAFALATLCFSAASFATEREFLARFEGSFSGGGTVQRNASERPNQVTCTMTGLTAADIRPVARLHRAAFPVNGDTRATMTIRNSGNGSLAITVTDELQPGGARAEVTQLALSQN